jgi:D-3-phosphoglycerate dehydrogenase / 2-oxoglutarate reductase
MIRPQATNTDDWVLLSLAPVPADRVRGWFEGIDGLTIRLPDERSADGVRTAIADAEILVSDWSSTLRVDAGDVEVARRLSFVMSPSVGLDSLDLDALTSAGVVVANTAGLNAPSVAEWCLAAAFAVTRSLVWVDRQVRDGGWPQFELPERGTSELAGLRVGVLGFGAVGSRVARLFGSMGCDVAYWTRRRRAADEEAGATWLALDELVERSDILIDNLALSPETRGLLDASRLALLPRGAIVIDAGRAGIVDHVALLAAVEMGGLRGAAIDVFEEEPLPLDSPLRRSDRILLSSHAASATPQALARMFGRVSDNIRRAIAGEPVESVVNGLDPVVRRRSTR